MRLIPAVLTFVAASSVAAYAGGDPVNGEMIFRQCEICHAIGPNAAVKLGPPLNGIPGSRWASWPNYPYSTGLAAGAKSGKVWNDATLDEWLTAPQKLVVGTKMAFGGLENEQQRADVIAYLKRFGKNGAKKPQ